MVGWVSLFVDFWRRVGMRGFVFLGLMFVGSCVGLQGMSKFYAGVVFGSGLAREHKT